MFDHFTGHDNFKVLIAWNALELFKVGTEQVGRTSWANMSSPSGRSRSPYVRSDLSSQSEAHIVLDGLFRIGIICAAW